MFHFIDDKCIGCGLCRKVCPVQAISGEKKMIHCIVGEICIDCSSCGRVCPQKAVRGHGKIIPRLKKDLWIKPAINKDKCYACENCLVACPVNALAMADESLPLSDNYAVLVHPGRCVSCSWCMDNCQFGAIRMEVLVENH